MSKYPKSTRWLLTEKILDVMREHALTYEKWALRLGTSMQRLNGTVRGKHRGVEIQDRILADLRYLTGKPIEEFYKEER